MAGRLDPFPALPATSGPVPVVVPEQVRQAALGAFDLRLLEAVIMDLVHDSCLDDRDAEGAGERRLFFDGRPSGVEEQVAVVIDLSGLGRPMRVTVTPARSVDVELRWMDGSATFSTSGEGVVVIDLAPHGLICLVLRSADPEARLLQTAWVRA